MMCANLYLGMELYPHWLNEQASAEMPFLNPVLK